jgi:hypothetical protein
MIENIFAIFGVESSKYCLPFTNKIIKAVQCYLFFNSTFDICLKFVFIEEMLDKLTTYIVWWYKTVHQVLSVAWTNRIATRRYRDS